MNEDQKDVLMRIGAALIFAQSAGPNAIATHDLDGVAILSVAGDRWALGANVGLYARNVVVGAFIAWRAGSATDPYS